MSQKTNDFDVIVIGAGPAGYVAATRATQLGQKTACIDNWRSKKTSPCLGGNYVNGGCISAVALLESAKLFNVLNHDIADHGISANNIQAFLDSSISINNRPCSTYSYMCLIGIISSYSRTISCTHSC